jgi:hypothetical protein
VRKYLFQRFLPNCNTDDINLEDCTYIGETNVQRILISELDEKIDTEENLVSLLKSFSPDDIIVLTYDRQDYNNPILREYAHKTLKSYIYWIRHYGYECYWENAKVA